MIMAQNGIFFCINFFLLCSFFVTEHATAFCSGRKVGCRGVENQFSRVITSTTRNHRKTQHRTNLEITTRKYLLVAGRKDQKRHRYPCLEAAASSIATRSPANLAVSIDRPLLPKSGRLDIWTSLVPILLSDAFKTAVIAFVLALLFSLRSTAPVFRSLFSGLGTYFSLAKGKIIRGFNKIKSVVKSGKGIPMTFGSDEEGWRACLLSSKEAIGNSKFVRYTFDLPDKNNFLPLILGQKISLCCLDDDDNVAKGGFYTASPRHALGSFSIVAPKGDAEDVEFDIGIENSNFARVLEQDLKIGDEVALLPGDKTLHYKGEYLPVTDMLYFGSGTGIIPIVDQVKSVLPSGISSVKTVSVVWVNENGNDFELGFRELKNEYYKYHKLRTISCFVDDVRKQFSDYNKYEEINDLVTNFSPGKMVVVSGPAVFSKNAVNYLMQRGYPEECICVLPA